MSSSCEICREIQAEEEEELHAGRLSDIGERKTDERIWNKEDTLGIVPTKEIAVSRFAKMSRGI